MTHHAAPDFWAGYHRLTAEVKQIADRAFSILKADPRHPSLHFKKVAEYWSVRVGLHHRALGVEVQDGMLWFWVGAHSEYDNIIH